MRHLSGFELFLVIFVVFFPSHLLTYLLFKSLFFFSFSASDFKKNVLFIPLWVFYFHHWEFLIYVFHLHYYFYLRDKRFTSVWDVFFSFFFGERILVGNKIFIVYRIWLDLELSGCEIIVLFEFTNVLITLVKLLWVCFIASSFNNLMQQVLFD